MSSFKISNLTIDSAVQQSISQNEPETIPSLVYGNFILSAPVYDFYNYDLPLTLVGDNVRCNLQCCNAIYCDVPCNLQFNWTVTLTVPSASKENPVYLTPYLSCYYDNDYPYNYAYNTLKIETSEKTSYTFVNTIQNTYGDLYTYVGMFDPLNCNPCYKMSSATIDLVAVKSLPADGGQTNNY